MSTFHLYINVTIVRDIKNVLITYKCLYMQMGWMLHTD